MLQDAKWPQIEPLLERIVDEAEHYFDKVPVVFAGEVGALEAAEEQPASEDQLDSYGPALPDQRSNEDTDIALQVVTRFQPPPSALLTSFYPHGRSLHKS